MVGHGGYSTTGGIQAVNRFVVRELTELSLLRRAFFLGDSVDTATPEGRNLIERGSVCAFGSRRAAYILRVLWHAVCHPNDLWLCSHVNYAILAFVASGFRPSRVGLLVYAYELDVSMGWVKRCVIRRFSRIIAISNYTARKVRQRVAPKTSVDVVHLGADSPPVEAEFPSVNDVDIVLFVGRMDERYKGQAELLDAMVLIRGRFPRARLVFVGGGRTLMNWKEEANLRDLGDVVNFTGRVSDEELQRIYRSAAVFAMPSENEGFGLVYVEAMAHAVPCIGSNRDAACEVIVHGETGFCVPAGNATALADAIGEILRSPVLRTQMATAARRRYETVFAPEHYRARLHSVMNHWTGQQMGV